MRNGFAGALASLFVGRRAMNAGDTLENPNVPISAEQLAVMLGGGPTYAGPTVGERGAMRSTAVYACVSLVSGLIGSLPLDVYEDADGGRNLAPGNRLSPLLGIAPNEDIGLTSFIWRELMGVHLNLNGNHYSVIEYDGAGRVVGFVPLDPGRCEPFPKRKEGMGWRRGYQYTGLDGARYELDQDEVLHIPGLGFDGFKGLSVIQHVARQTIGAGLALEESAARMLANGARISGIVTQGSGKPLSPEALLELKREFRTQYQSAINSGEVAFLDNGMSFTPAQMTLKDAELLESRKFSVVDIARAFGVPPFLIGETADMTAWGSGLEQIMLAFLLLNLERWLKRIEGEMKLKLFSNTRFYPWFDRDALNATNAAGRADFFQKSSQSGWTFNEIRRKQHLPRVEGGDEPLVPSGYMPLSRALQSPATQPARSAP